MNENNWAIATSADVVGILGSPRRGGNSQVLLESALKGAADRGLSVATIILNDLKLSPCQNCGYCDKMGECRIKDDMVGMSQVMETAPRIIVSAPIYFTNLSAQTKIMIDRCQPYWARRFVLNQPLKGPKRAGAFISVGGFKQADAFFECAKRAITAWFSVIGVRYRAGKFYSGVDAKGDAERHPTAVDDCYQLGAEL